MIIIIMSREANGRSIIMLMLFINLFFFKVFKCFVLIHILILMANGHKGIISLRKDEKNKLATYKWRA